MTNLSLFLDHNGYALTEFVETEGEYNVNFLAVSDSANGKKLIETAKDRSQGKKLKALYYNKSKYLQLLVNELKGFEYHIKSNIQLEEGEGVTYTFDEGYQILNTLLAGESIAIAPDFEKEFETNLKNYNHPQVNHLVYCLFYGIAEHEYQRVTPKYNMTSIATTSPYDRVYDVFGHERHSYRDMFRGYDL